MKLLIFVLLTGQSYASIPVLSPDGVLGSLTADEYTETLISTKEALDRDLMQTLTVSEKRSSWKLSQIVVGLGINGEIGVGPYKFGTTLKQRFIFVRKP